MKKEEIVFRMFASTSRLIAGVLKEVDRDQVKKLVEKINKSQDLFEVDVEEEGEYFKVATKISKEYSKEIDFQNMGMS